jgi:hypothetical protein
LERTTDGFSKDWTCVDEDDDESGDAFPRLGKTGGIFSKVWKNAPCGGRGFHVKSAALPTAGRP